MKKILPILMGTLLLLTMALPGQAAMGKITGFDFQDFDTDLTGPEGPFRPDGEKDAHFTVTIEGIGALASLSLRRESDGTEWSPRRGRGLYGMRVRDASGNDLSNADGSLPLLPFLGHMDLDLFLPAEEDRNHLEGSYTITIRFVDGSETTARTELHISEKEEESSRPREITRAVFLPYPGEKRRNLVGSGEKLRSGGKNDRGIELQLQGEGRVEGISVKSVSGRFAAWDTYPSNRRWLLGIEHRGNTLNNKDGSVSFRLENTPRLTLWLEDNGAVASGDSTFQVIVTFSDGKQLKRNVALSKESRTPTTSKALTFMGHGGRDLVGYGEKLGSDGQKDWRFRLNLNTRGTLIGLTLLGENRNSPTWDTLPGNRIPLLAVTDSKGRLINRQNGSIKVPLYGKTTLYLWASGRSKRRSPGKNYRVKAVFDDGRVLEFGAEPHIKPESKSDASKKIVFRARYLGRQDQDRVSPSEILVGDSLPDNRIRIYIEIPGKARQLKTLSVETRKPLGQGWDTIPGNGKWAILVTDSTGEILNGTDGSILINLEQKTQLSLWLGDRGELSRSGMDFRVKATLNDDTVIQTRLLR